MIASQNSFKIPREKALENWLEGMKRIRKINDDFGDGLECEWQIKLVPENKHSSLFCSLAEWNTNITDLLEEKTYDNLKFDDVEHRQKLFRHYSRILLVTSEILTDMVDFMVYINQYSGNNINKNNKAKKQLSNPSLDFSCKNLFDYINSICKHKIGNKPSPFLKYHKCNHHMEYNFKDSGSYQKAPNTIRVENIKVKKIKKEIRIEMPKLEEITNQIIFAHKKLDKSLNRNGRKRLIRSKLEVFEKFV
jgi:hypothetical protein